MNLLVKHTPSTRINRVDNILRIASFRVPFIREVATSYIMLQITGAYIHIHLVFKTSLSTIEQ